MNGIASLRSAFSRIPAPGRGALWVVAAWVCLTTMHGLVRHISIDVHPFEITFFRYLFGAIFMFPWMMHVGMARLRTRRPGLHGIRALVGVGVNLCWFTALSMMPLAEATALNFTAPLFATLGAAFLLRETVSLSRWSATAIGFVGALIILRPGVQTLSMPAMLALASAAFAAGGTLCVRSLSRTESSDTIVLYQNVLVTLLAALPTLFVWSVPSLELLVGMAIMGFLATLGHLALARALAVAEASVVAPFNFSRLIFAALIGYAFFGEIPDALTWIGGAVIFGATLYMVYRESQRNGKRDSEAG